MQKTLALFVVLNVSVRNLQLSECNQKNIGSPCREVTEHSAMGWSHGIHLCSRKRSNRTTYALQIISAWHAIFLITFHQLFCNIANTTHDLLHEFWINRALLHQLLNPHNILLRTGIQC